MMTLKRIPFIILLLALVILNACSSDGTDEIVSGEENQNTFNRQAMLTNWSDNIIIPSYNAFEGDASAMVSATSQFTAMPNEETLQNLRNVWVDTYISFQNVAMFDIGKAGEVRYRNRLNIYPTNPSKIEGFVADGSYDLSLPSTIDAQGFPAIDYLINGSASSDAEIVALFSTHANASNYKAYLTELSTTIKNLTSEVLTDWQTGFRDSFVANTSSSANGSVDQLANDFIFYYERALRAGKIGIPAGNFSNGPLPENVEAFYKKDISKALALQALRATQDFFEGTSFNSNATGESFKSYLDFLNTIKNGEDLSTLINAQFNTSRTKMMSLNANFVEQISTNNTAMLETYDELQRNVILLKVDMLQALDINVDFVDTDGD